MYNVTLDEIDQLIVDGLKNYVDVSNAALKAEREAGRFILGGKLKQTPQNKDKNSFEELLSLGMAALNENQGENLADPIPNSKINQEIHQRLFDHFMGRTNHGLRSALASMGLEEHERKQYRQKDIQTALRAADRAAELISGRQQSAGYPITGGMQIVGGHLIGRATSKGIGMPEQITARNNMEVEGALEGQSRHEYRGKIAAERLKNKFIKSLISNPNNKEIIKVIDALEAITQGDERIIDDGNNDIYGSALDDLIQLVQGDDGTIKSAGEKISDLQTGNISGNKPIIVKAEKDSNVYLHSNGNGNGHAKMQDKFNEAARKRRR